MRIGIFVTGTNTGIGKTVLSSFLVSSLNSYGIRTGYFKPVQTGTDSDTATVADLTLLPVEKFPRPVYSFPEPMSPNRAALLNNEEIQIDRIVQYWQALDERAWVVEGAGGLLVPLNGKQTIRDLAQAMELKILVVASTALGTINHTLLTLEAAKSVGLGVVGIVLMGPEDPGLETMLSEISGTPVIATIPQYPTISQTVIQEESVKHFPAEKLRLLYE